MSHDGLLSVRRISKTFPGQRALIDVDLSVDVGEVHALLGHNGSGKSTLIKILAGFHLPDPGGEVLVRGTPLELGHPARSAAEGLRFVHQDLALVGALTVAENMAFTTGYARSTWGTIDTASHRERTCELLSRLGAALDVDRRVDTLDPIDRAIVGIARALDGLDGAGGLLVLDEPTAALPPDEVGRLFEVVRSLRGLGVSCLYVTHRMDEVHELTDTFTVLRDGQVRARGATAERTSDELIELILGQPAPELRRSNRPAEQRDAGTAPLALDVGGLRAERLDDVSLQVAKGEVLGVAGVLGSGREAIGPALTGAVPATAERYVTSRGELDRITPRSSGRAGVVMVPGTRGVGSMIDDFTVTENLTFATLSRYHRLGWINRVAEHRSVSSWIKRFSVRPARPDAALSELSGGNKQKVLVAKWLQTEPGVLVMDEPTSGVDVGASAAIHEFIRQAAATDMGCIVASSDLDDLIAVATRVIVMDHGRIAATLVGDQITEKEILHAMSVRTTVDVPADPSLEGAAK